MDNSIIKALKLKLNDNAELKFYGRDKELNKLVSILNSHEGSATLVSGDRGSGKTSTIREAVKRSDKARNSRVLAIFSWTRKRTVCLDVPLVSAYENESALRKDVLRLMVQSLVVDYKSASIFDKSRFPLTYKRRLRSIEELLMYKSIVRQSSRKLNGTKYSLTAESEKTVKYEYDLAYADIELQLKAFFVKYSKILSFIIIFDELDKYIDDKGVNDSTNIKPHQYIRQLKNLFTITLAKFIFTSTEDYYQEINEDLASNALKVSQYKFNLFTHKILFNQLDPGDYSGFLRSMFVKEFNNSRELERHEYQLFEQQMAWHTNGYPFLTKKKISELAEHTSEGARYIDLLNVNENFPTYGTSAPFIQYVLNRVYHNHITKSELTNRYVYKALKKIGDIFYSGTEIVINKSHFYAILFIDAEDISGAEKDALFQVEFNPNRRIEAKDDLEETWEFMLDKSDPTTKTIVNTAITDFIWHLDGLKILAGENVASSISMVRLYILTNNDEDTLENVIKDYETITKDMNKIETEITNKYHRLDDIVFNTGIQLSYQQPISLEHFGNQTLSGVPYEKGWGLRSLMEDDLMTSERYIKEANQLVAVRFADIICNSLKAYTTSGLRPMREATTKRLATIEVDFHKAKKLVLLVNPSKERIEESLEDSTISKTVIVLGSEKKNTSKIKNSTKLKYFEFSNHTFSNFEKLAEETSLYIRQQIDS